MDVKKNWMHAYTQVSWADIVFRTARVFIVKPRTQSEIFVHIPTKEKNLKDFRGRTKLKTILTKSSYIFGKLFSRPERNLILKTHRSPTGITDFLRFPRSTIFCYGTMVSVISLVIWRTHSRRVSVNSRKKATFLYPNNPQEYCIIRSNPIWR